MIDTALGLINFDFQRDREREREIGRFVRVEDQKTMQCAMSCGTRIQLNIRSKFKTERNNLSHTSSLRQNYSHNSN